MKNNKGFTLVETIVTLVIAAIALTMIVGILFSSGNIFHSGVAMNEMKMIGDNAFHFVSERLRYATNVKIYHDLAEVPDDLESETEMIYVDSSTNRLMYKKSGGTAAEDLYGETYYHGNKIMLEAHGSGHSLELTVCVMDGKSGEESYQAKSTIKLLNLQVTGGTVEEELEEMSVPEATQNSVLVFSLVPEAQQ